MRKKYLSVAITFLIIFGLWEFFHRFDNMVVTLPGPIETFKSFGDVEFSKDLISALWHSLSLVMSGLLMGTSIGYIAGLLIGIFSPMLAGPYHFANALKATPVTVLIPIFLSIFGLFRFLLPLLMLPTIVITASNIADAVENTSRIRRDLLRVNSITSYAYIRHVVIFETIEPLLSTLRVLIPLILAIEVAVDYFLNTNHGLGALVAITYQSPNANAKMYATIIVVMGIGISSVIFLDQISRKVLKWKRDM